MSKSEIKSFLIITVLLTCLFTAALFAQEEYKYDSKGKRNPFIPLVTPDGKFIKLDSDEQGGKKGFVLEGIIYDKNGISYALVNGVVVKTGDIIGEYQVLKIEKNKIQIIKEGLTSEIELEKGEK